MQQETTLEPNAEFEIKQHLETWKTNQSSTKRVVFEIAGLVNVSFGTVLWRDAPFLSPPNTPNIPPLSEVGLVLRPNYNPPIKSLTTMPFRKKNVKKMVDNFLSEIHNFGKQSNCTFFCVKIKGTQRKFGRKLVFDHIWKPPKWKLTTQKVCSPQMSSPPKNIQPPWGFYNPAQI